MFCIESASLQFCTQAVAKCNSRSMNFAEKPCGVDEEAFTKCSDVLGEPEEKDTETWAFLSP